MSQQQCRPCTCTYVCVIRWTWLAISDPLFCNHWWTLFPLPHCTYLCSSWYIKLRTSVWIQPLVAINWILSYVYRQWTGPCLALLAEMVQTPPCGWAVLGHIPSATMIRMAATWLHSSMEGTTTCHVSAWKEVHAVEAEANCCLTVSFQGAFSDIL